MNGHRAYERPLADSCEVTVCSKVGESQSNDGRDEVVVGGPHQEAEDGVDPVS